MMRTLQLLMLMGAAALGQTNINPNPVLTAVVTNGDSATFSWTASPSSGVTGYKMYYLRAVTADRDAVEGMYLVGNVTSVRLTGLTFPASFYVTAIGEFGDESMPSNMLKDLHWETDVTVRAQSGPVGGPFTNAFTVLTKTNVQGAEFYRLIAEQRRFLRTVP